MKGVFNSKESKLVLDEVNNMKNGDVFTIPFPFKKVDHPAEDLDGPHPKVWSTGVHFIGDDYGDQIVIANGEGKRVLKFISKHKPPGKFHERIFYTQHWITPDGEEWPIAGLKMVSSRKFKKMLEGFQYEYEIEA